VRYKFGDGNKASRSASSCAHHTKGDVILCRVGLLLALRRRASYRTLRGRATSHRLEMMDNYGSNFRISTVHESESVKLSIPGNVVPCGCAVASSTPYFATSSPSSFNLVASLFSHNTSTRRILSSTKHHSKHHSKPQTSSADPARQAAPSPPSCLRHDVAVRLKNAPWVANTRLQHRGRCAPTAFLETPVRLTRIVDLMGLVRRCDYGVAFRRARRRVGIFGSATRLHSDFEPHSLHVGSTDTRCCRGLAHSKDVILELQETSHAKPCLWSTRHDIIMTLYLLHQSVFSGHRGFPLLPSGPVFLSNPSCALTAIRSLARIISHLLARSQIPRWTSATNLPSTESLLVLLHVSAATSGLGRGRAATRSALSTIKWIHCSASMESLVLTTPTDNHDC
jgi:hypothetical protein